MLDLKWRGADIDLSRWRQRNGRVDPRWTAMTLPMAMPVTTLSMAGNGNDHHFRRFGHDSAWGDGRISTARDG